MLNCFEQFINDQVRHMFDEIDYILEGQNAERFASLYSCGGSKILYLVDLFIFVFERYLRMIPAVSQIEDTNLFHVLSD